MRFKILMVSFFVLSNASANAIDFLAQIPKDCSAGLYEKCYEGASDYFLRNARPCKSCTNASDADIKNASKNLKLFSKYANIACKGGYQDACGQAEKAAGILERDITRIKEARNIQTVQNKEQVKPLAKVSTKEWDKHGCTHAYRSCYGKNFPFLIVKKIEDKTFEIAPVYDCSLQLTSNAISDGGQITPVFGAHMILYSKNVQLSSKGPLPASLKMKNSGKTNVKGEDGFSREVWTLTESPECANLAKKGL